MGHSQFLMKWNLLRKTLKLLFLLCFLFAASIEGSDSDKSALLELKASLSDPYRVLDSWNLKNPDHCSWTSVSCDSVLRVVSLNLTGGGNSLSCVRVSQFPLYGFGIRRPCVVRNGKILGKLSASVAKLSELKILAMPFNELSGEIPVEIWAMEKLEVLDLEGNLISGSLPSQIRGLKKLRVLNLGFNMIFGAIPVSLSNFVGLQVLNLAGNQINGSIPEFVGGFGGMTGLYLSFNLLSGSIPAEIGDNCWKLEYLELAGNYLVESIPKSLGNCRGLKSLLLYSNMLEEVIPSELGELSQLEVLDVSRNNVGGPIPPELGNCTKLSVLVLSNVWNPLPNVSSLGGCYATEKLASTVDDFNFYEGTIPKEITTLSSLRVVWAPRAMLQGTFPANWGSCNNLEILNLAQNYYSGKISEAFSNCKKLDFLDLSSNSLTGGISDKIRVPCMTLFDVSGNRLSGPIPKFIYPACAPVKSTSEPNDPSAVYISYFGSRSQADSSLPFFKNDGIFSVLHNFGSNNLTGFLSSMPIASERLGKQTVYAFLAGNNKLTGAFPGVLFEQCDQLRGIMVNVSYNGLLGQIPTNLATSCKSLILLDVSSNQIGGNLPPSIGDLVSLIFLNLSWNTLRGSIPSRFDQIKNLKHLSLSGNNLNGPIPTSLGQLSSLEVLELSSNSLSGAIPENQIKNLKHLSLSGNNLNGPIPTSLGQLSSLEVLELSSNSLSGAIPENIGNLRKLTVLLLNNNNLSGQFPPDLTKISTLTAFNVSFNKLSGEIPSEGPFVHFGYLSFISNEALCGISRFGVHPCHHKISRSRVHPRHHKKATIHLILILLAIMCIIFIFTICIIIKIRRKTKVPSQLDSILKVDRVSYYDLERATNRYNEANVLGTGSFGTIYKGILRDNTYVAVKVFNVQQEGPFKSFDTECDFLRNLRHRNLIKVISSCSNLDFRALILEYMPNGSLEKWLYSYPNEELNVLKRLDIMIDVASAIDYLHHGYETPVVHCDLKPSNILLDENMVGRVCDFGIAKLVSGEDYQLHTETLATFGYIAPEYGSEGLVSTRCDVYSYGIVLMETFTKKRPSDDMFVDGGLDIRGWINDAYPHNMSQVIDKQLLSIEENLEKTIECISLIMKLALDCSAKVPLERIDIKDALITLKKLRVQFFHQDNIKNALRHRAT